MCQRKLLQVHTTEISSAQVYSLAFLLGTVQLYLLMLLHADEPFYVSTAERRPLERVGALLSIRDDFEAIGQPLLTLSINLRFRSPRLRFLLGGSEYKFPTIYPALAF